MKIDVNLLSGIRSSLKTEIRTFYVILLNFFKCTLKDTLTAKNTVKPPVATICRR